MSSFLRSHEDTLLRRPGHGFTRDPGPLNFSAIALPTRPHQLGPEPRQRCRPLRLALPHHPTLALTDRSPGNSAGLGTHLRSHRDTGQAAPNAWLAHRLTIRQVGNERLA